MIEDTDPSSPIGYSGGTRRPHGAGFVLPNRDNAAKREGTNPANDKGALLANRVIAHVSAHFRRTTVEAIAATVGLSTRRLASVFAEQMEMTVTEYMAQVKLEAERPQLAKMVRRHAFSTVTSYRAQ